jgi:two-component system, NarL family, response regulator DegU
MYLEELILKSIVLVSGIPILIQEIETLLMNHFYQRRIRCIKTLEGNTHLTTGDFLIIFIQRWSSRELLELKKLHREGIKIIIWFANDEKEIATPYLKEGFDGYLPHCSKKEELISAIERIESEDYYIHKDLVNILYSEYLKKIRHPHPLNENSSIQLTKREWDILLQMTEGFSNDIIAQNLNIRVNTAKNHVSSILRKLQVTNRNAAVVKAIQFKWVVK